MNIFADTHNVTAYHAALQHVKQLCTALEIHQRTLNCKATFNYELTKGNSHSMKSMPISLIATQLIIGIQTINQVIFFFFLLLKTVLSTSSHPTQHPYWF